MRRNTTSAKKGGLMGGLLGAFSSKPTPERRQSSKVYESEDGVSRHKRGSVYEDDSTKRLRRDDRKIGRSRKMSEAEGQNDAAPVTDAESAEAKEARRAERRAKREQEAAEDEARAARKRRKRKLARRRRVKNVRVLKKKMRSEKLVAKKTPCSTSRT